jgi:nucleotide-binding universal stress UspA family protein
MTAGNMRHVLLHGGLDEAFDRSAMFARRLAETFGARLHILYTVEQGLQSGWTAEVTPDRMIDLHQAMEAEARERLARLIPLEDQERLGVEVVLVTGPASSELVRYTKEHSIDLAIVKSPVEGDPEIATALLEHAQCAVLVLR